MALQASLSIVFSRQECWSELPFPPPGDLPSPGIEPVSPMSPAMAGRFFTTKPPQYCNEYPWPCIFECMCEYVYREKKKKKEIFVVELGIGLLAKKTFKEVMLNFACITSV